MKVRFIKDVVADGKIRFAKGLECWMSLASAEKWIAAGFAERVAE